MPPYRAFQGFSGFTSGIGVHYAPSLITSPENQSLAAGLVVGQRLPPRIFIRAADARPFEIQDLLPADTRFKILLFTGDSKDAAQKARVLAFADSLEKSDAFFRRHGGSDPWKAFDVLTISTGSKHEVSYTDFPEALRPHWSK